MDDVALYCRGTATLVASWREYARGAADASVQELDGVDVAVFPNEPERSVYNNALLADDLGQAERAAALEQMERAYREAKVSRFAVWAHESDTALRSDLEQRGYALDGTTLAMGLEADDVRLPRPDVELARPDWSEHLRLMGLDREFLAVADPAAYHLLIGSLDGRSVSTAMAFDNAGDCGIYNVTTLPHARRRGLGTALTAIHVHDALARGCTTASLQSTQIAEGVYRTVGFRDLGRILEYVPPGGHGS